MSLDDLWVIVEGRDHDRPHYEQLLDSMPSTRGKKFSIRLAEEIELNGTVAGGKKHALALHDHFHAGGDLIQRNKAKDSRIVFMLDRDRDDFLGLLRSSPHVMYTRGTDVEADILLNSEIWTAAHHAYGIDSRLTEHARRVAPEPAVSLLNIWSEWLRLGLEALGCGAPGCAPWSQLSMVNDHHFGAVDVSAISAIETRLAGSIGGGAYSVVSSQAAVHLTNSGVRLLKGRWIARYVDNLVKVHMSGNVIRAGVRPDHIIDTAMARLRYTDPWTRDYDRDFARLFAMP